MLELNLKRISSANMFFPLWTHTHLTYGCHYRKVSPPPDGDGWLRPKDVMEELGNPHGTSSSLPRLPSSAVNIVVSLMRRNPCEVLSSLRPGTGADGRLALIGHVLKAPPSKDREGVIDGADDCLGIRCALEVAWDMETRGICVRRFSMETNEKRPRCVVAPNEKRSYARGIFPAHFP